ncbi:MAG: hypothetical protein H0U67_02870 [Gemmatimonadetes bacterium]|nr:hypothetical protein [Gemmatimonadota bacterium]
MLRRHPGLLLVTMVFAACGATDSSPATSEIESGEVAFVTADHPPLTSEGWGPLRIGISPEAVVEAAGEDANPDAVGGPYPDECDELRPVRAPVGMIVMLEARTLTRISLRAGSQVRTDRGIGVGDPASAVREIYGNTLVASPHKYRSAPSEYLTVQERSGPGDELLRGIVYEIGNDGNVERVHAGGPSIQYVEGCL